MVHFHERAVGFDQLQGHFFDIVQAQLRGGVGIEHGGPDHIGALSGPGGLDGQQLDVDVGHIHGGADGGQGTDEGGMDTGGVHQAGDLHAGGLGEIGDQVARVQHIAADADGLVGDDGLHADTILKDEKEEVTDKTQLNDGRNGYKVKIPLTTSEFGRLQFKLKAEDTSDPPAHNSQSFVLNYDNMPPKFKVSELSEKDESRTDT